MPFKKCSFCSNNNKNNGNVSYFKITEHILDNLGLPSDYGQHICSEHFLASDIKNKRLIEGSLPSLLHLKSSKEHDHGYAAHSALTIKTLCNDNHSYQVDYNK